MFMTRSFNVTPKTTEQHLTAHSDKSVAYVTNNKRLPGTRRFVLLKLTTDRHEASRGLFATAQLLIFIVVLRARFHCNNFPLDVFSLPPIYNIHVERSTVNVYRIDSGRSVRVRSMV